MHTQLKNYRYEIPLSSYRLHASRRSPFRTAWCDGTRRQSDVLELLELRQLQSNPHLGSIFGSAVGGILGGSRGSDFGTVIGGATGAALGAASAESARKEREEYRRERAERQYPYPTRTPSTDEAAESGISYGRFESARPTPVLPGNLEVTNIVFADANGDRVLQPGEQAEITFDIYNRGTSPVRNVTPLVTSDYDRINVSQPAIISEILPGQGFRYRAAVLARSNAKTTPAVFKVAFPDGQGRQVEVRRFTVNVVRP